MAGLYAAMGTSTKLETEGIWLDLDYCRILLARAGGTNKRFNTAAEQVMKKNKKAIEFDMLSADKNFALLHEIYADTVVLDWLTKAENGSVDGEGNPNQNGEYVRGIEGPSGEVLPFDKANVIATFAKLRDLFLTVKETAENMTFFRQALIEEKTKN